MGSGLLGKLRRAALLVNTALPLHSLSIRPIKQARQSLFCPSRQLVPHIVSHSLHTPSWVPPNLSYGRINLGLSVWKPQFKLHEAARRLAPLTLQNPSCAYRNLSYGRVNLVLSDGKAKFETHEVDPPKKDKFLTKKRFQVQKRREKEKRKAANRKDPRRLTVKGKKKKFSNAEERIKCKIQRAKIKEALLLEKLKRYEVPKVQGPEVKPPELTGEERFFMKKMAQKSSNYVPVGRRGIFGGVILNMHMHWKKHETVKVICKFCKPGQVHNYAQEIARLSGGIPIQIIGSDTIIFYRGKNYLQPEVMSPIDTLSKKRALQKSKYEQSLESVRRFISIAEKELELYYRHIALYGPPNRNAMSILESPLEDSEESKKPKRKINDSASKDSSMIMWPTEAGCYHESSYSEDDSKPDLDEEIQDDFENIDIATSELDSEDDSISGFNFEA